MSSVKKTKSEKAQQTKKKIIQSAEQLLLDNTINKISVRDITTKANVAKGTFYLYFDSKEELAWTLVEKSVLVFDQELTVLSDAPVTKEVLRSLISKAVDFSVKHKKLLQIIHHEYFLAFLQHDDQHKEYEERFTLKIQTWLDRGNQEGIFQIPDTYFYAKFMLISLHDLLERMILGELDYDLASSKKHLTTIMNNILGWGVT